MSHGAQVAINDDGVRRRSEYAIGSQGLDAISPINEDGSFRFDRVLRRGKVLRRSKSRHAFKPSWRPGYLVLRPHLLSFYKDEEEACLELAIDLFDISAVAPVKAPGSKRPNVFGVFSPSKNYRFQATSSQEADAWVEDIRNEFRAEHPQSAAGLTGVVRSQTVVSDGGDDDLDEHTCDTPDREVLHGPLEGQQRSSFLRASSRQPSLVSPRMSRSGRRRLTQDYTSSAYEVTSCSELSDAGVSPPPPIDRRNRRSHSPSSDQPRTQQPQPQLSTSSPIPLDLLPVRRGANELPDPERVLFHGYLQCLRGKKGVRKWKKLWAVLRVHSLCFYKSQEEYAATQIIPMGQVIDAAEVDPLSRSKTYCFQLIMEEMAYRFCAPDEESLDMWLGSLKSALVSRQDGTHVMPVV